MPVPLGELRGNVDLSLYRGRTPLKHTGRSLWSVSAGGKENKKTPALEKENRKTPGSALSKRRALKDDLVELLSTSCLSELQAELKAISPFSGRCAGNSVLKTKGCSTPAPVAEENVTAARGTDVHAPRSACISSSGQAADSMTRENVASQPQNKFVFRGVDLFHCSPAASSIALTPTSNWTTCQDLSLPKDSPEEIHDSTPVCSRASTLVEVQSVGVLQAASENRAPPGRRDETLRKREPLLAQCKPLGVHVGKGRGHAGNRRRSSILKAFGGGPGSAASARELAPRTTTAEFLATTSLCRPCSRTNSRSGSRRHSLALEEERRRTEELSAGQSAGALKFRELRNKLDGHKAAPTATPPSPGSLWRNMVLPSRGESSSIMCTDHVHNESAVVVPKHEGVIISLAPQDMSTFLSLTAVSKSPEQKDTFARLEDGKMNPWSPSPSAVKSTSISPSSPLSDFINMFQAAQEREMSKHILRVWKKRTGEARRLSGASYSSLNSCNSCSDKPDSLFESPTSDAEEEAPASDWSRRRQHPSHGLSVNSSSSALSHQVSDVQVEKSWPISTDDDDEWRVVDESCPDKGVCGIRERTHGPRYDNQGKHAGMRQMLQHGGALNDAQQWKNACAAAMRQVKTLTLRSTLRHWQMVARTLRLRANLLRRFVRRRRLGRYLHCWAFAALPRGPQADY